MTGRPVTYLGTRALHSGAQGHGRACRQGPLLMPDGAGSRAPDATGLMPGHLMPGAPDAGAQPRR
jgi:hypothetical protein